MVDAHYATFSRRHFFKHLAGFSLMAVPGMQFLQSLRAATPELKKKGKSLILLWMSGGPSHMDIWDLKPGTDTGGEFKPIKTAVRGIDIGEHMPVTAKQFKNLSLIRSLASNEGSHERGRVLLHTARQPSPLINYPSLGAVASHQLTLKELDLPGFITINGTSEGPGFLGMNYAPFTVQNPGQPPANIRPPETVGGDMDRVRRRQRLFFEVEDNFTAERRGESSKAHGDIYKKAFSLVASPRGKVFNLNSEKKSLVDDYGANNFGRGCLLARKLVEAGVTAVEVDLGGWDMHNGIFPALRTRQLPMLDKGMGTLVKDLSERGLIKNTVIVWMGEFGRTPRINQNAGRDHWGRCWSVVVGGGNIKGGQVYGATSKDGMDIQDNPCSVGDLFATIFKGLGMDPELKIRDNIGRPTDMAPGKPIGALV